MRLEWSRMGSGVLNGKIGNRTVVTIGKHTGDNHFIVSFKPLIPVQHLRSEEGGKRLATQLLEEFVLTAAADGK